MSRRRMSNRRAKDVKGTTIRVLKDLFSAYPKEIIAVTICIILSSAIGTAPNVVMQQVTSLMEQFRDSMDWVTAGALIKPKIFVLIGLYVLSIIDTIYRQEVMAYVSQGFLSKMRIRMFEKMQKLPIKYFDTNKHGDIMSHYTNDVDTMRQLITQTMPSLIRLSIMLVCTLGMMFYYSFIMSAVIIVGTLLTLTFTRRVNRISRRYFQARQDSFGKCEGFIQEIMNGQKVVKVFNHEEKAEADYEVLNQELTENNFKAQFFGALSGPISGNIGNLLYLVVTLIGGALLIAGTKNVSLSGLPFDISIVITSMRLTRQFNMNLNQMMQNVTNIAMALAGAERVYELMDEEPEDDEGYVFLVNAIIDEEGNITESEKHTGQWAWKHQHGDGTLTYQKLEGDVVLENVDFAYEEGKPVLHDINVYAKPGQKVAFVGATGAGKTTITNLINRFYDIADGKIRYDGINVNKIKKGDLRRSIGLVLQDTNLFTGTVRDNIRYGKLDATDEEIIEAARLAGADDFITRLPQGYDTMLTNNGANLSQGQRQLLAIARAAVADPPVMILDEATSSIDTRTEAIVQRGMDKLMEGRTVFVIAHRLSTVMNSDVIMVLDHGRIIERGSHDKLIEDKGVYYQLYTGAFELE